MTFKVKMTYADGIDLRLNRNAIRSKVGRKIAAVVKKRMRAGLGAGGPLPEAEDKKAKQPLNRSGQLIKSIKYKKGLIFPRGTRDDSQRNAAVMAIQIHTRDAVETADPMGVTDEVQAVADEIAQKEIARQFTRRIARLEAKRLKKRESNK